MNIQPTYKPSTIEAYTLTALIIFVISIGIIKFELTPHIPIIVAITVLILYGLLQRVPFVHLQTGLANGAMSGLGAVFLLFFIGILLAAWMISGTIPTLIYTGFAIVTPNIFTRLFLS